MHGFRVWAPRANRVELKIAEHIYPLEREPLPARGWWSASIVAADAAYNTEYAYLLDGDPLSLPDPRSAWQPHGVHGPSRLVEHSSFQWSDINWQSPPLASAIFYELHIGTFTPKGTFDSAIERLDKLVEVGITHVEIMPVAAFPGDRGWGYDGVDLFAPQESYGGPQGLKRLVDACHARGLAILLDVVYNHLGPDGNYLGKFGPYFTAQHSTPWGDAVNLEEAGSTEVRRFLCDNALMWLGDYHFDGLRLDAVHAYIDRSAIHFLEQLTSEVAQLQATLGRHLVLIAESDLNDPRLVTAREGGGYGLDAMWSDDFHHALVTALTGERVDYYEDFGSLADVAAALEHAFVYDGRYSTHRDRNHGRPAGNLPGWRFVGCAQNHDQVGNRARGERLGQITTEGRARIAAALVLTSPFLPLLFQGEEFSASTPFLYFTHHQDEKLAQSIVEGRRNEFASHGLEKDAVPSPQSEQTYRSSQLDWSEREREPHASMLAWYQALIRLRRTNPHLSDGRLDCVKVRFDEQARRLAMDRGPVTVICNLGAAILTQEFPEGTGLLLSSEPGAALSGTTLSLPPDSVAIVARPLGLQDGYNFPPIVRVVELST